MGSFRGAVYISLFLAWGCAQEETKMIGGDAKNKKDLSSLDSPQGENAVASRNSTDQDSESPDVSQVIQLDEEIINYTEELIISEQQDEEVIIPEQLDDETASLVEFACATSVRVLKANEFFQFVWQISSNGEGFQAVLEGTSADIGTINVLAPGVVNYLAPGEIDLEVDVTIRAYLADGSTADCNLKLQADQDLGVKDDGLVEGLVGSIYQLDPDTKRLPDFSQMSALTTIVSSNLDVPKRAFDTGFPGVPDLFEWFGIAYKGLITIPADGKYEFQLSSDDGSILYLNDELLINNDGTHAVQTKTASVNLSAGQKSFALDYFQGPRYHIALQLKWKTPGSDEFVVIPKEFFQRQKSTP